jgi:uncharacterized spore protein YtfJ
MNVDEIVTTAKDTLTVKRIYGEPYQHDGVTVIPVASVAGGFGGGAGTDEKGQNGEGGGFGMSGRPAGLYVIKGGDVSWRPAVDPARLLSILGMVAVAYLLTHRRSRGAGQHPRGGCRRPAVPGRSA